MYSNVHYSVKLAHNQMSIVKLRTIQSIYTFVIIQDKTETAKFLKLNPIIYDCMISTKLKLKCDQKMETFK